MAQDDASSGADQTPEPGKQDRRRLPPELTGLLPRSAEQGLDHVVRRRILRALHGRSSSEASPAGLLGNELTDESLSGIAYHARVLETCGLIRLVRTEPVRGAIRHIYASGVEDDPVVLSVLAETAVLDAPARGSQNGAV